MCVLSLLLMKSRSSKEQWHRHMWTDYFRCEDSGWFSWWLIEEGWGQCLMGYRFPGQRIGKGQLRSSLGYFYPEEAVDPLEWPIFDIHLVYELVYDPFSPHHVKGFLQVKKDCKSHLFLGWEGNNVLHQPQPFPKPAWYWSIMFFRCGNHLSPVQSPFQEACKGGQQLCMESTNRML